MPIESQLGTKDETTYGTAVTVDRFQPYLSESLNPERFRTRTPALRADKQTHRSDEYAAGITGVAGSVEFPIYSNSFGVWLKRALGAVTTTGPTTGAYQHVGTIDPDACLGSFTTQVNRALAPCASTDGPFTVEGCQIESWELSCSVEELLTFSAEIIAEDCTSGTSLAAASYSTMSVLSWAGASLTVDAVTVPIMSFSLKCSNNLKGDRLYLQNSTKRSQAPRDDFPELTVEFECDFDAWTEFNKSVATTAAGTQSAMVFTVNGPSVIGTSGTYPGVTITLPAVDITEADANVSGGEMLTQTVSGMVLDNGTDEPISFAYRTSDATP